jgi:peptidyl-tRNA hydrolase, PTH1 family
MIFFRQKKGRNMYIIVGLGNPTREYQATRHNIGFDVITRLSDDFNIPLDFKKHKAICGKGMIEGEKVVLAQPQTYMNLSGESVRELVDFYKVSPCEIIVIYDDISLEVGQLRLRGKGSAGGHNGIKSIIQHLGSDEFLRIKVGVGDKPKGWDLADYVLSRFKEDEQPIIRDAIKNSSEAVKTIIKDGMEPAMNLYNRK